MEDDFDPEFVRNSRKRVKQVRKQSEDSWIDIVTNIQFSYAQVQEMLFYTFEILGPDFNIDEHSIYSEFIKNKWKRIKNE